MYSEKYLEATKEGRWEFTHSALLPLGVQARQGVCLLESLLWFHVNVIWGSLGQSDVTSSPTSQQSHLTAVITSHWVPAMCSVGLSAATTGDTAKGPTQPSVPRVYDPHERGLWDVSQQLAVVLSAEQVLRLKIEVGLHHVCKSAGHIGGSLVV